MKPQGATASDPKGEFLIKKSVFLLTSSVGQSTAEKLIAQAVEALAIDRGLLSQNDIPRLSEILEPSLRVFVGAEKARRLAAALRVLVGGVVTK